MTDEEEGGHSDACTVGRRDEGDSATFPDLRFTIDDMLVEGDKMMARWTMSGTHEGDFYGVQPTHKQVAWSGIGSAQMSDGKNVA